MLHEYASQNFGALTLRPRYSPSRQSNGILEIKSKNQKYRPVHAQKNWKILVLQQYASQEFSTFTPRLRDSPSRKCNEIFLNQI